MPRRDVSFRIAGSRCTRQPVFRNASTRGPSCGSATCGSIFVRSSASIVRNSVTSEPPISEVDWTYRIGITAPPSPGASVHPAVDLEGLGGRDLPAVETRPAPAGRDEPGLQLWIAPDAGYGFGQRALVLRIHQDAGICNHLGKGAPVRGDHGNA